MYINPDKFHEFLLNSLNIRVDPTLTEYFSEYLKDAASECESVQEDEEDKDYERQSYVGFPLAILNFRWILTVQGLILSIV